MNIKNAEKGISAEKLFEQYLNDKNIPFYRIDQTKETKSEELKNKKIRRPDYLIHTKKGVYYVDVKYREKKYFGNNSEERFPIDQYNINALFQFQEQFNEDVWLAFTNELDNPIFNYTTISNIYEYYENIKKIFEEKNYKNLSKVFIYLPNKLFLFDQLSYEQGFYKEPDLIFFEDEANYLSRIAHYR